METCSTQQDTAPFLLVQSFPELQVAAAADLAVRGKPRQSLVFSYTGEGSKLDFHFEHPEKTTEQFIALTWQCKFFLHAFVSNALVTLSKNNIICWVSPLFLKKTGTCTCQFPHRSSTEKRDQAVYLQTEAQCCWYFPHFLSIRFNVLFKIKEKQKHS